MNWFARFTKLWAKDKDEENATLKAALAVANDLLETERTRADDAERELRPFQEYVIAAEAHAAAAAADAAAQRDAAEAAEAGDGSNG